MENYSAASRLTQKLVDDDIRFAVIGECCPGIEGVGNLHRELKALGFRCNQFIGRWIENGELKEEHSLLIPDISLKKALIIAQKHEFSAIVYKNKNGCQMVCTAPFESYQIGDVIMTFKINKENPLNTETMAKLFSGKKQKTVNSETAESFTLTERVLVSTFYGLTEEKVDLRRYKVRGIGIKGAYNGYRYLMNDIQYDERKVIKSDYSSSERSKLIEKSEEHGIIVLPEGSVKEDIFLAFINSLDKKYCKHKAAGFFLKSGTHYNGNNAFTENSLSVEVIGLSNSELINLCEKIIRELSVDTVILKTEPSRSLFFIER